MSKSKQTAAHFSYFDEFDMSALERLRKDARAYAEKQGIPIKVTYLPFIIKAVSRTLMEHPTLNASMDDDKEEIILKGSYNIGIAVDTENGLMVPVIKDADQKSIWELSTEIQDLAGRARTGKLKLDEITGGTFTLTNIGPIGGLMSTPVINYPEVGIIGIHKGKLRPVVLEDSGKPEIAIRRMMYLSISVDHRVTDGANAARFMNQVISYLENPATMFLDIM
jgi:pyruvate dehydrogenase E2 component (dihydrolipoamide acetyltransferase)